MKNNLIFPLALSFLLAACAAPSKRQKTAQPEWQSKQITEFYFKEEPVEYSQEPTEETEILIEEPTDIDFETAPETEAVVVDFKTFDLGANPMQSDIISFRHKMDRCFIMVMSQLNEEDYYDKGFSYMIAPNGAVYPFSKTKVECVAGSPYAENEGKDFCEQFLLCAEEKVNE